jgi:hypothetical protein
VAQEKLHESALGQVVCALTSEFMWYYHHNFMWQILNKIAESDASYEKKLAFHNC